VTTRNTLLTIAGVVACAIPATACSVATPDTSQAALHYSAGPFSSQTFENCVTPGTRQVNGASDFYYPNGRRTLDFTGGPGSELQPLKVTTRNAEGTTEVTIRGVVTFSLNTDCQPWVDDDGRRYQGGVFQAFHDRIGRANNAFAKDGGDPQPDSWTNIVTLYVGGATEKALDNEGLAYDFMQLKNDAKLINELQTRAEKLLPDLLNTQAGGPFFVIHNIQIQSVDIPDGLRQAQEQAQAAKLRETATQVDTRAAKDYPGGVIGYDQHQLTAAIIKALNEGRGIPVPYGTVIDGNR
jgi:hypothetical protein